MSFSVNENPNITKHPRLNLILSQNSILHLIVPIFNVHDNTLLTNWLTLRRQNGINIFLVQ